MKVIISSIIVVLFSCNSTKKTSNLQDFPSGNYEIVELKAENFKPKKTYTININTEEQRIGGQFDCNTYTCEYEKEEKNIDFGYAISTKMYCEGKMNNENAFFGKLNSINKFEYEDETLKFFGKDDGLILELKFLNNE